MTTTNTKRWTAEARQEARQRMLTNNLAQLGVLARTRKAARQFSHQALAQALAQLATSGDNLEPST